MSIQIFGFQALWSPYFFLTCVAIVTIYFLVTVKWRHIFVSSEQLKRTEAIYFILAIVLLYILKGSPIDLLGHILFTMHMTQMALLLLLFPVFFIKGVPAWMWYKLIDHRFIRPVFQFLTKPILALFVFTGLFSMYHLPAVFDTVKMNIVVHELATYLLIASAICMYWPLMQRIEGQRELSNIMKLAYIAGNAVLITPACALIIFANEPLYATFRDATAWLQAMTLCVPAERLAELSLSGPQLFTKMTLVADQQVGGVLMKIIQEIIFGVVLFQVFTNWWRAEKKDEQKITEQELQQFKKRTLY